MKRIKALAERAAESVKDRMAAKDAAALSRRLSAMDSTPDEVRVFSPGTGFHGRH